jgi:hypothetical protein
MPPGSDILTRTRRRLLGHGCRVHVVCARRPPSASLEKVAVGDLEENFSHISNISSTFRLQGGGSYDVDAAFMQLLRHDGGNHAL